MVLVVQTVAILTVTWQAVTKKQVIVTEGVTQDGQDTCVINVVILFDFIFVKYMKIKTINNCKCFVLNMRLFFQIRVTYMCRDINYKIHTIQHYQNNSELKM